MIVPRYRENPLITQLGLLCPGISQNSEHHHLTLIRGQVLGEKSYPELCNDNILNILYDPDTIEFFDPIYDMSDHDFGTMGHNSKKHDKMEQDGELYVPPLPGLAFTDGRRVGFSSNDRYTQLPWEGEMMQSFAALIKVTYITLQEWTSQRDQSLEGVEYQIKVGNWRCTDSTAHDEQCASLKQYYAWYIWTKEGFNILINLELTGPNKMRL